MKRIFLGPQGPPSYIGKWTENGLRMIERWINTLVEFRGAAADRDGADGLVPQPMAGDENKALFGDGHWRNPSSSGTPVPPGTIPIYDIDGDIITDADFRYDPTTDTLYAPHISAQSVDADVMFVDPEVYGPGWDGDNSVPTKNDVYDKIQSMLAGMPAAVPLFYTNAAVPVSAAVGLQEYTILASPALVVDVAVTKIVWLNATLSGGGYVRKKIKTASLPWSFDIQLKKGSSYYTLAHAQANIPSNGKWTPFSFTLVGSYSRPPAGTYSVVLTSNCTSPIVPGALTISLMGQGPK